MQYWLAASEEWTCLARCGPCHERRGRGTRAGKIFILVPNSTCLARVRHCVTALTASLPKDRLLAHRRDPAGGVLAPHSLVLSLPFRSDVLRSYSPLWSALAQPSAGQDTKQLATSDSIH